MRSVYCCVAFNTGMVMEAWLASEQGGQYRCQNTVTFQCSGLVIHNIVNALARLFSMGVIGISIPIFSLHLSRCKNSNSTIDQDTKVFIDIVIRGLLKRKLRKSHIHTTDDFLTRCSNACTHMTSAFPCLTSMWWWAQICPERDLLDV